MNKPKDRSKLMEITFPGVDFCFEPIPDKDLIKGPPVTSLDRIFARMPKNEEGRAWARNRLAMEPMLLLAARNSLDRSKQADVHMELALCHYLLGDLHKGRAATEQAVPLWEQAGDGRMMMECLMRSAHFHQIGGDVPTAIAFYERALAYPVPIPTFRLEARYNVLLAIAELHGYLEDHAGAVDALRRALDVAQQAKLPAQMKESRMALCAFLTKLSRWQEALDAGLPLLAEFKGQSEREQEQTLRFLLADLYRELDRHRESAEQYEELLRQARAARAPRTLMIEILMKAGTAWMQGGEQARAGAHFKELLPLADSETSRPLGVIVRLNLATLAREGGEPKKALQLLDKALLRAPQQLQPMVLLAQGEAHASLKQWDRAVLAFRKAVSLARQMGDADQEAALLARLSALVPRGEQEAAAAN